MSASAKIGLSRYGFASVFYRNNPAKAIRCSAFSYCTLGHGQLRQAINVVNGPKKIEFLNMKQARHCSRNVHEEAKILKKPDLRKPSDHDSSSKGYPLLIIPIITFGLGTWQVYRKRWKEGLIKEMESKWNVPPVDFPEDLDELKDLEYRKVRVRGCFDHSKEIYLTPRSLIPSGPQQETVGAGPPGSKSGSLVITPFKLEDRDLTILVNRGWVPRKQTLPQTRPQGQVEGVVELTGVVRSTEKRPVFGAKNDPNSKFWHYKDLDMMSEKLGTAPILIDADRESSVPGGPIGGQTRVNLRNEHLSYIITWYSLSLFTSFLWYRRFVHKIPLM